MQKGNLVNTKRYHARPAAILACLCLLTIGVRHAHADLIDSLQFWVGQGPDEAALVIDWNDGLTPASLVWGYRWDSATSSPTGEDMLRAIAAGDSRMYLQLGPYGSDTAAHTVYGLGYDLAHDGFAYVAGANDTGHAADAADHFQEGWKYAGYWRYYIGSESAGWSASGRGMNSQALTDGCWNGWSWSPAPTWNGGVPDSPTPAVPEPGTLILLSIGAAALLVRVRAGGLAFRPATR